MLGRAFVFLTDYVKQLMKEVIRCRHVNPTITEATAKESVREIPRPLSSCVDKVDKITAVEQHKSRFNLD